MRTRPKLPTEILENVVTESENFQNRVLRPIIKMKSELLMTHISAKLNVLKIDWEGLKSSEKKEILTALLSKDQAFKSEIVGMTIGNFDLDEFKKYHVIQKEVNRRITQIVLNRSIDILI